MTGTNSISIAGMSYLEAESLLLEYQQARVGVTVATNGPAVTSGYVVAVGETTLGDILSPYAAKHSSVYGGWYDERTGRYMWELVRVFASRERAIYYGRLLGQYSIFDLETGEEIVL